MVKIIKLTYQMISKSSKSHMNRNLRIRGFQKKPKLSNFTLYIRSNCPRKSTPKFRWILNSSWSNEKLKGQTLVKINKIRYPHKADRTRNPMKNFKRIGLKIREKSLFGNQQKSAIKFRRNDEIFDFLNSNYLSKSNLNYINCKDYEGITLLT